MNLLKFVSCGNGVGGGYQNSTRESHNLSLHWQMWGAWRTLQSQRTLTTRGWSLARAMQEGWQRAIQQGLFLRGEWCIQQVQEVHVLLLEGAVLLLISWVVGHQFLLIDLPAPTPSLIKLCCLLERDCVMFLFCWTKFLFFTFLGVSCDDVD